MERLRDLHKLGYVHNDIKLENMVIGAKDPTVIYLIDFGMSVPFEITNENGIKTHIERKFLSVFTGNFLFASRNSLKGY